jgi:hypothetical protein
MKFEQVFIIYPETYTLLEEPGELGNFANGSAKRVAGGLSPSCRRGKPLSLSTGTDSLGSSCAFGKTVA